MLHVRICVCVYAFMRVCVWASVACVCVFVRVCACMCVRECLSECDIESGMRQERDWEEADGRLMPKP